MRKWTALQLHRLATRIYNGEERHTFSVRDDYDICRCSVDIYGDQWGHGVSKIANQLPLGWRGLVDDKEWS
jgi:hypothetical protein